MNVNGTDNNGTYIGATMKTTTSTNTIRTHTNQTSAVRGATQVTPDEQQSIEQTQRNATPATTKRTYHSHVVAFAGYCAERGWAFTPGLAFVPVGVSVETLPNPARVDWVLAHLEFLVRQPKTDNETTTETATEPPTEQPTTFRPASLATLDGRIRALNAWHKYYGYTNHTDPTLYTPNHPAVVTWLAGYRNELALANANGEQTTKETPGILRNELRELVRRCDTSTLSGLRDRALLLIGWNGAFRRSELVAFCVENKVDEPNGQGFTYKTYNTKANRHGVQEKQIHAQPNDTDLCPVVALNAWLERAGITSGVVFRNVNKAGTVGASLSARMVDKIVREYDNKAGINKGFSAHSLRAGYATQATLDGIPDAHIRAQGWADSSHVVFRYQRRAERFKAKRIAVA
jgi:integrase